MMIKNSLLNEIKAYCKSNDIEDVSGLVNKMLTRGFSIVKFGETPNKPSVKPKVVEKIVEKIVEKTVEVIKEVPVDRIVKVSDDAKINELLEEMDKKESEHLKIIETFKEGRKKQAQEINKLIDEKDLLKRECDERVLELEKKLKGKPRDIYGDEL